MSHQMENMNKEVDIRQDQIEILELKSRNTGTKKMRHRKQKVKPWTLIQQVTTNNTKHEWNKQSSQMESARRDRKT